MFEIEIKHSWGFFILSLFSVALTDVVSLLVKSPAYYDLGRKNVSLKMISERQNTSHIFQWNFEYWELQNLWWFIGSEKMEYALFIKY